MSKPIRLFKLVTGELVLGKFDEEANMLEDVAIIQVICISRFVWTVNKLTLVLIYLQREGKITSRSDEKGGWK